MSNGDPFTELTANRELCREGDPPLNELLTENCRVSDLLNLLKLNIIYILLSHGMCSGTIRNLTI